MKNRNTGTVLTVAAVLLLVAADSEAQRRKPDTTTIRGHTMYTLMPPGGIPAIFEPQFIPVARADSFYYPDEPLIVVVDGVTAKGYSAWHLDGHEVVNDFINNKAIAVTW